MKNKLPLIVTFPIVAGLWVASSHAETTHHEWNFSDPDGTAWSAAVNTGTAGTPTFNGITDTLQVSGGALRWTGDAGTTNPGDAIVFDSAFTISDDPIFTFNLTFGGWNLDAFPTPVDGEGAPDPTNRDFDIELLDGGALIARYRLVYRDEQQNTWLRIFTANGNVESGGGIFNPVADVSEIPNIQSLNFADSVTFSTDINFADGTMTHFVNGQEVRVLTGIDFTSISGIRLSSGGPFDAADAFLDISSMSLSSVPEPSAYAAIFAFAALAASALRRRRS